MIHSIEEVEALGGYSLIYADPAWQYDQGGRGAVDYDTLTPEEIHALPVSRIAAKNAVLFLWGTWPQLPIVMATFPAWGFEYKTNGFVWVKYHDPSALRCVGGGFWTRANTEFCLIGVRGEPPRRVNKAIRQLIETADEEKVLLAPRPKKEGSHKVKHSAKPPEARDRIVQLMGELPRIELFSRNRVIGWDAWGDDEALGGSDVDLLAPSAIKLKRAPNGTINNCALANGDEEKNCQMCRGVCPDRSRFLQHPAAMVAAGR